MAHYLAEDRDTKLIWLVRDPRAVWSSRLNNPLVKFWCLPGECGNLERLCKYYEINTILSERLSVEYPDRFRVVKFEGIAEDPVRATEDAIEFIGLDNSDSNLSKVKKIQNRTNFTRKQSWEDKLDKDVIRNIEELCRTSMEKLGYFQQT